MLDPDVPARFPDSKSVNRALRRLIRSSLRQETRVIARPDGPTRSSGRLPARHAAVFPDHRLSCAAPRRTYKVTDCDHGAREVTQVPALTRPISDSICTFAEESESAQVRACLSPARARTMCLPHSEDLAGFPVVSHPGS